MNRTYLLDGAILAEHAVDISVLKRPETVHLYDDLGEQAARVGPILTPETPETLAFANSLINAEDSRCFATSLLLHRCTRESLVKHLFELRYLETTHEDARRYFLRYADTRALYALSQAAELSQLCGLLGPISRWTWVAADKTFLELTVPRGWEGGSSALPLQFSPKQLSSFLNQCRFRELLQATLTPHPSLANCGTLAERLEWTQHAYQWLRQQGIERGDLQVMVNEATLRTRGTVLTDQAFSQVVQEASSAGAPQLIRDWAATFKKKQSA